MQRTYSFNFPPLLSPIVFLILGFFLFKILKYIYIGLLFAAPVMIIAILLIRKEVLANYFKRILGGIRNQPLTGILNALISIFFLPFSLVGMLATALFTNKIEKIQDSGNQGFFETRRESGYTDFVDLSDEISSDRKSIEDWDVEEWENKFK